MGRLRDAVSDIAEPPGDEGTGPRIGDAGDAAGFPAKAIGDFVGVGAAFSPDAAGTSAGPAARRGSISERGVNCSRLDSGETRAGSRGINTAIITAAEATTVTIIKTGAGRKSRPAQETTGG
jgi:hypothetical protein